MKYNSGAVKVVHSNISGRIKSMQEKNLKENKKSKERGRYLVFR